MNELQVRDNQSISIIDTVDLDSIQQTLTKISQLQALIQSTLKEGHDYGVIPGTNKPTMYKPGAEKVQMLFGVTSEYEVTERIQDYEKGFFAFTILCTISRNGTKITEGVGHCNTKETKYIKQDPYTLANTCLKMAKKRAQVDATLTLASLSEIFTQDIEDMKEYFQAENLETMTAEDAAKMKVTFGKHKGKTLKEIFKTNKGYLEWMLNAEKTDESYKKAIQLMFDAAKNHEKQKQKEDQSQPEPPEKKEEFEDPFAATESFDISDDDLPFDK
ncbi:hypothetical protein [Bacillus sp. JCM 19034]|uniref:exodeoxyribonuclease X C-terminal domain-containing protein n=1 Tax=Bacillus sp. JCM 19034 TaxID=1481928 RepID=UPI0007857AB8|nr:hypothetical protein [Bacillus sp. JCM 19034]